MAKFTKKQAEALWRQYNTDGNDTLSVEEVQEVIKAELLKSKCEQTEEGDDDLDALVKAKYAYFRQKEAKALSKKEFIDGCVMAEQSTSLKGIFKTLDTDGSGSLTIPELKKGLSEHFTKEEVEILMDEVAEDKDKAYDIDEFIDAVAFSEYCLKTFGY